jgi:hypothetical protein
MKLIDSVDCFIFDCDGAYPPARRGARAPCRRARSAGRGGKAGLACYSLSQQPACDSRSNHDCEWHGTPPQRGTSVSGGGSAGLRCDARAPPPHPPPATRPPGVIWRGDSVIEGVPETLDMLRALGKKLVFVTNNSTKSRKGYLGKFTSLGLNINAVSGRGRRRRRWRGRSGRVGKCGQTAAANPAARAADPPRNRLPTAPSEHAPPTAPSGHARAGGDLLVLLRRRRVPRLDQV